MIEGPGHVPFDQIEFNMKLQRRLCHGAPFYVLGPLVTDIFPGYDHITSAIGATAGRVPRRFDALLRDAEGAPGAAEEGRREAGLRRLQDRRARRGRGTRHPGCARPRRRADEGARAALNWEKHFELSFDPDTARAYHDEDLDVDTDFCAMCGHDWCSVRISKEIETFVSGKDPEYAWDKVKVSEALTAEQVEILDKRGVLAPNEVHRLASKTRHAVSADAGKAACHSDTTDDEEARALQEQRERVG